MPPRKESIGLVDSQGGGCRGERGVGGYGRSAVNRAHHGRRMYPNKNLGPPSDLQSLVIFFAPFSLACLSRKT